MGSYQSSNFRKQFSSTFNDVAMAFRRDSLNSFKFLIYSSKTSLPSKLLDEIFRLRRESSSHGFCKLFTNFSSLTPSVTQPQTASRAVDPFSFTKENFKKTAIKAETIDQQTTIIMGKICKFVEKEISVAVEPMTISTEQFHEVLHVRLDYFVIRLVALERSDPSSDVGSLKEELRQLRAAVQVVQARDQIILEDYSSTTQKDIVSLIRVKNLIDDEDSPTYPKGKRK
ncbi:hypothetical protein K7X08_030909 [Anisodus acutangulus]|uniref:Uncharacterized protein n=1 Tax=Anisodus acutangulus TaxID=402998 RepID=A0A9Q1RBU5_9SOLA|nr:hypothetical protein K7X08_030909 [Anisodus acutangulus]